MEQSQPTHNGPLPLEPPLFDPHDQQNRVQLLQSTIAEAIFSTFDSQTKAAELPKSNTAKEQVIEKTSSIVAEQLSQPWASQSAVDYLIDTPTTKTLLVQHGIDLLTASSILERVKTRLTELRKLALTTPLAEKAFCERLASKLQPSVAALISLNVYKKEEIQERSPSAVCSTLNYATLLAVEEVFQLIDNTITLADKSPLTETNAGILFPHKETLHKIISHKQQLSVDEKGSSALLLCEDEKVMQKRYPQPISEAMRLLRKDITTLRVCVSEKVTNRFAEAMVQAFSATPTQTDSSSTQQGLTPKDLEVMGAPLPRHLQEELRSKYRELYPQKTESSSNWFTELVSWLYNLIFPAPESKHEANQEKK